MTVHPIVWFHFGRSFFDDLEYHKSCFKIHRILQNRKTPITSHFYDCYALILENDVLRLSPEIESGNAKVSVWSKGRLDINKIVSLLTGRCCFVVGGTAGYCGGIASREVQKAKDMVEQGATVNVKYTNLECAKCFFDYCEVFEHDVKKSIAWMIKCDEILACKTPCNVEGFESSEPQILDLRRSPMSFFQFNKQVQECDRQHPQLDDSDRISQRRRLK